MYCIQCGTEIKDGAKYCSNCGTKVINNAEDIHDHFEDDDYEEDEEIEEDEYDKDNEEDEEQEEMLPENLEEYLKEKVDRQLGTEVTILGGNIYFRGEYFLRQFIYDMFLQVATRLERIAKAADTSDKSCLIQIAKALGDYVTFTYQTMDNVENYFAIGRVDSYYDKVQSYLENSSVDIMAAAQACIEIEQGVEQEVAYREARKACRSRWVGGGFGFSGAITGAAKAAVLNAGSGLLHSTANLVGNAATYSKANRQISGLLNRISQEIMQNARKLAIELAQDAALDCRNQYPDIFFAVDEEKENRIKVELARGFNEKSIELARELILSNPYKLENYQAIYNVAAHDKLFDSFENNIRDIIKVAQLFKINFAQWLNELMQTRLKEILWTETAFRQEIIIEKIIFNTEKMVQDYDSRWLSACQKEIREGALQDITVKVNLIKMIFKECPEKNWEKKYQDFLSYDLRQAENCTQSEYTEDNNNSMKRIYAQKELASGKNADKFKMIIPAYVLNVSKRWIDAIDLSKSHEVIEIANKVRNLDQTYECTIGQGELNKSILQYISKSVETAEYKSQIDELQRYMYEVSQNAGLTNLNIENWVEAGYKNVRTVLGKEYTTFEEAEKERRRTVGNKRFASEADADRERELIRQEMGRINGLEKEGLSFIEILSAIKQAHFRSEPAKEKEYVYDRKVIETYTNLKQEGISSQINKKKLQRIIYVPIGIVAVVLGINPLLTMGWLVKIIAIIIMFAPWGLFISTGDELKELYDKRAIIQRIEELFVISNNQIFLRNEYYAQQKHV